MGGLRKGSLRAGAPLITALEALLLFWYWVCIPAGDVDFCDVGKGGELRRWPSRSMAVSPNPWKLWLCVYANTLEPSTAM